MSDSLICHPAGCLNPAIIEEPNPINKLITCLQNLYDATTDAGDNAAQHWANVANGDHPLAPLANIPGVFAALWTPDVAPTTAITLATASYGFIGVPKNLIHFTTALGARGIGKTGIINATRVGLFGPGAYLAEIGRPINLFVRANARIPIMVATPAGTVRIIPYLVYVRWGLAPIILP